MGSNSYLILKINYKYILIYLLVDWKLVTFLMNNFKLSRKLIFNKINVNEVNFKVTEVTKKNQSSCFLAKAKLYIYPKYSLIQKNGDSFATVYSSKCVTVFWPLAHVSGPTSNKLVVVVVVVVLVLVVVVGNVHTFKYGVIWK